MASRIGLFVTAAVLGACASEERPEQTSSTTPVSLSQGPTTLDPQTETSVETTDAPDDEDDDDETGDKLDVGGGTGMMTAGDDMTGCTKVDLIFVVDGSGS